MSEGSAKQSSQSEAVKRVGLATLILSAGILCSRLLGYLREAVIAYQAGASAATDAYNAAFLLPDLMNYFLAGGTLSITFIPLLSAYLSKNDEANGHKLFSLIATTMGSILLLAIIVAEIFTPQLVSLLFPGFNSAQIADTVTMTRVVLPAQLFHYLGGLMMAILMTRGKFLPSALAPLIYNLGIIVGGLLLAPHIGMMGFAVGALSGALLGPFLLPLIVARPYIKFRPYFNFADPSFRKYWKLTLPLILGVSLTTVDEWLGRIIGSSMEVGSISWLNYARRLCLVPIALVGQAASQAALPYLSRLAAAQNREKLAEVLTKTLRSVILLSLVASALFVVAAEPGVALVYERGAFSESDTARTTVLLQCFSFGIVAWTVQMVMVRAYYAEQNTLSPMFITSVITLLSIGLYYALSQIFGLLGLALASSIGMAIQALSVMFFYRRKNPYFRILPVAKSFAAAIGLGLASAAGAGLGLWISSQLPIFELHRSVSSLIQISASGALGLVCAAVASRFLCKAEFDAFKSKVLRRS
ncbi:MAG: murein biosynthesis integral membrane protein MurJ [Bradymonadales bacterium]|jgi:putative peptidoglycan lipid II flippase